MLAPVGYKRIIPKDRVVHRNPPAQFRLQIDSQMFCRVHLDSPRANQGEAESVLFPTHPGERRIQTEIPQYAAADIDVKPGIGGEDPIQPDRNPEIMDLLPFFSGLAHRELRVVQGILPPRR